MKNIVLDIEADDLLDKITKIHCLSYYCIEDKEFETITSYKQMSKFLLQEDICIIGHNIIRYDIPALEKILSIKINAELIDTLGISWYLYPERKKHGLEEWGIDLGIKKPEIKDWSGLSIDKYIERCEEDVKINAKLWGNELKFLNKIYQNEENLNKFLKYLHFKLDCVREQEEVGLSLNIEEIKNNLHTWTREQEQRNKELEQVMPKVAVEKTKIYTNATKFNGNIFTKGDLFFQSAVDNGATIESSIKLSKIVDWNDPNSSSFVQIKKWLEDLGWIPEHIKHVRDKKTNEIKLIPQIKSKFDDGELCNSVKKLFEKEPKLELLEGLFMLNHRISILEGFLKDEKDGKIYPSIGGLTNTLRLKHKIIVNLPAIYKKYGREIRGSIISPEGYTLIGSDLSNIEDRTKRHYIYKYDPKYVEDMNTPGYDAHLELGLLAGFLKQEDIDFYKKFEKDKTDSNKLKSNFTPSKEDKNRYESLKKVRNKSKVTNFSATYKVGKEALSRNANIPLKEAGKLLKIYWDRNSAILDVENECNIREVDGTRWLQNPISNFWYSLRSDKDKFSTLNQGSAVYIFDLWVQNIRNQGVKIPFQYHDEILICAENNKVEEIVKSINKAIEEVNEKVKLNIEIGCGTSLGENYSETH